MVSVMTLNELLEREVGQRWRGKRCKVIRHMGRVVRSLAPRKAVAGDREHHPESVFPRMTEFAQNPFDRKWVKESRDAAEAEKSRDLQLPDRNLDHLFGPLL
jgi:hypothetical protein